jgi:putative membrane protein
MTRTSLAALSLILSSTLFQCGGEQKPAAAPEPAPSLAPAELAPVPTNGPDPGPPPAAEAAADTPKPGAAKAEAAKPDALNDDQIAAITDAANNAGIEEGKIARLKSKDSAVQKFAAKMIAAHEEAKKNQDKLKLGTAESVLGNKLGTESSSEMNTLKSSEGKDFDRAYIDAQVDQHQKLLDALNDHLIPSAKNPDLKAYLSQMQPHVARHLKEAQDIQQALMPKAAAVSATTKGDKSAAP